MRNSTVAPSIVSNPISLANFDPWGSFHESGTGLARTEPKGPTMDHPVRRLAMRVEDHSLEYFDFEGVLEKGTYGAGDVTVWDWGTWEPTQNSDPADQLKNGELHAELFGSEISGRFVLVRSRGTRHGDDASLLIRKCDEQSVEGWGRQRLPGVRENGTDER